MSDLPPLPFDPDAEFPIRANWVYANHASVSPLPRRVACAMRRFADAAEAQGATQYDRWKEQLEKTRALAARLIGCRPHEVAYVKSTTHGLMCAANSLDWREGDNVALFGHEFPANYWPWKNLERLGVETRIVPLRPEGPALDDLEARMDGRTRLAAVSFVGYANGFRIDGARFGDLCRRRGVLACLDGIQGLGAVAVRAGEWGIDFLSADGHKWLLGPEGYGFLYCSDRVIDQLNNSMTGWCSRQIAGDYENYEAPLYPDARRFEEGSHNMICAHALGAAADLLLEAGMQTVEERILGLIERLAGGLRAIGWETFEPARRENRSGILMASKPGASPARAAAHLNRAGIFAAARGGKLRFSPHFYNDEDEMDRIVEALRTM